MLKVVSPGYWRIGHHFFKQFANVCRHPIHNRCAIQSIVITFSILNRAAFFTFMVSLSYDAGPDPIRSSRSTL